MVKIDWTEDALDDLDKLDRVISQRVVRKVEWAASHFEQIVPEPLEHELKGSYKIRIGDWRVVYEIEKEKNTLVIRAVGHRREIYRI